MAGTNGAKRGGANGGGGSGAGISVAREERKTLTTRSPQSVTAKLLDGLAPKDRISYLNDFPIGTEITVESRTINGGKATNTLVKTEPNYQGYDWKVVSGPKSDIAHFDSTFNPAKDVAYGTKIIGFKLE